VYIVLPNGMHAEYTVRAAQAGKHVLCEKPMANSVAEGERMIAAARRAGKKLMIAYRLQYEPYNREVIRLARAKELGHLKGFLASNGQVQGDPKQWRLNKALAGGGSLPDVGIYCLNAARYITGEEPVRVSASLHSTPKDPRFAQVEEQVDFRLQFPSGLLASCSCSYGYHGSKIYRVLGDEAWAELDPAFPYRGQRLSVSKNDAKYSSEERQERQLEGKNHFALEMDHMAHAVLADKTPHTPGEEGLQDLRVIAAIYRAAAEGKTIDLPNVDDGIDRFRGPAPA
jgi:predicted dehydrogenase